VFVSLVALTSLGAIFLHAPEPDVAATTVQHSLASNKLGKDKTIFVHLPEEYDPDDEEKTYPVLYVLNRTENFNIASQIVDFLSSKGNIPEMIVVGIPHSGNSRSEYKPYETDSPSSRRVAVDALRAFLKSELVPFIDEAYHTKPSKILVGHSLAGLFTTDVFLNNPDLFNAYIALSPSYHHGPEIINAAERFMKRGQTSTNTVFYGNIGGDEFYRIFDHYHNMQSLFEKHAPVSIRWNMKEADNNSHRVMPLFGLYDALTTIYAGFNLSMPQFRNQQYEGVIAHYQKLSDEMGYKIKPTRDDLESLLGYFVNPDRASDPTVAEHANEYAKAAQKLLNYYYP
jgi:predicted alpha/beta superfamily hydrolase